MTVADTKPSSNSSPHGPQKWWQWWVMYPSLGIAILGAIPTVVQGVRAISAGASYGNVPFVDRNNDLFAKNFDCLKRSGSSVELRNNTKIEAVVCDSGDIWVRVTTADSQSGISWIALADVVPKKTSGIFGNEAFAASLPMLAQAGAPPLCVFKDSSGKIVRRVVVSPGKCQDEQIDPNTGRITVVPAECSCPH